MENNIVKRVVEHSGRHCHPRIMLKDSGFDTIRTSEDFIHKRGRAIVIERADAYLTKDVRPYEIPDGIRLLSVSRAVLDRALTLGMAYRLTGNDKYAERLWREMESVAEFKDWNPRHFLDVGEMCNAMGIAYDWIYEWMTAEQRAKIRAAIVEKGFNPVMDDYLDRERSRTYRWYQDDPGDNWKFVCNGGVCVALLAICDEDDIDPELCQTIFDYGFKNTYRAVRDMYLPDGSYVEGFTYWEYATTYFAYYVNSLMSAVGTDFGLSDYEPVVKSAFYLRSMCSGVFISFNFGDAIETCLCSDPYMFIGKNYNRPDITAIRAEYLRKNPDLITHLDLISYTPSEGVVGTLPLDCGSVGGTNASFRSGWGEGDLFAAIHYGANDVCHAHADMGNFVIEWDGKRFFSDHGQDNYNVPNYSKAYRFRAEGHNTLVINPSHGPDQVYHCESYISRYEVGEATDSIAVADMSVAYPGKKVVRGMRMPVDRRSVIVRDELELDPSDTVYWFGQTKADIKICDDRRAAILEIEGSRLWVGLLADGELEILPATHLIPELAQEGQRDNSAYQRLTVKLQGGSSYAISVCFVPLSEGEQAPEKIPVDKPLSEW